MIDQKSLDSNDGIIGDCDRRNFLAKCGVFGAITTPAITMLLSTSLNSNAIAQSAQGNCGGGNGSDPAPPGGGTGNCSGAP